MSNEILKISAIKTNDDGYYVTKQGQEGYYSYNSGSGLTNLFFDGVIPNPSLHPNWLKVAKLPKKITKTVRQQNINHRFELIDPSFANEKVPLSIKKEEAGAMGDGDDTSRYEFYWNEKYAHLKSLYRAVSDPQPDKIEEVPFEVTIILEIDQIKEYAGFSYPVQKTSWAHEGFTQLTNKEARHNLIDTIVFPGLVLSGRESKLTSEQSYKIIRKHVQDNIDPKWAVITSDYNFCFTVQKKIPLCKPIPYQKDISRYGARKPKFVTDYRNSRSIKVFEMGHSGEGAPYKGYEAIKGFEGANIEELKMNIDEFLKDLMEKINAPLKDCPHCNGLGVELEENKS